MKVPGLRFDTTYTTLPSAFFAKVKPAFAPRPALVIVNHALVQAMGITLSDLSVDEQTALFSGNQLPQGAEPFASAYAGHQFGGFTMLGDGRAVMWGEHLLANKARVDIQLKGSGQTPYSRQGDGKAALGPMLREYIISEAMHHLGIPTTRSLAVASTGERIQREGLPPGAVLTRVAKSHLRVGTFQFVAASGDQTLLKALLDYTIKRHFTHLSESDNQALALLQVVMDKQIELVTAWMRVGFIHGVMNTDNMSLAGETIDYGPCAFMDSYDPHTVFSAIDHNGRYAYDKQPQIAQWNLARFAETLLPLIHEDEDEAVAMATNIMTQFPKKYQQQWLMMMRHKLGLNDAHTDDEALISTLLAWMQKNHADYTNTFLDLSQAKKPEAPIYQQQEFNSWYARWQNRRGQSPEAITLMRKNNPAVIARNHKVEEALKTAEQGNFSLFQQLLQVLQTPYSDGGHLSDYQNPPKPSERIYQTFCGT